MGQEWEVVGGLENLTLCGFGRVTLGFERLPFDLFRQGALATGPVGIVGQQFVGATRFGFGFVPNHLQRLAALLGGIGIVGHDGHSGRDLIDLDHARDLLGFGGIKAGDLGPKAWRMRHHGDQHIGQVNVLCELRCTVALGLRILAANPIRADQGEGFGILQGRCLGR